MSQKAVFGQTAKSFVDVAEECRALLGRGHPHQASRMSPPALLIHSESGTVSRINTMV